MHSNADCSTYDGWEVTGWPEMTISRGEILATGNDVRAAPGRGRLAARGPISRCETRRRLVRSP
jgi:dihydropyrimidinase